MTTPFAISVSPTGAEVSIDGAILSHSIIGLELAVVPGEPAHLVLHIPDAGEVMGDGVVTVMRDPTEAEMRERLGDWLAALDPVELDNAVKERLTSMRDSYASKVIEVLAEVARG